MTAIASVITLVVILLIPGQYPAQYEEDVDSISVCWAMAREVVARAEHSSIVRNGGTIGAACEITIPHGEEH